MGHRVNEGLEVSEPKSLCSSWVWDRTVWTPVTSGPLKMSLTYGARGQVTSLRVPSTWDTRRRNIARALATSWQLNIEEQRPMFQSDEVWTMDNGQWTYRYRQPHKQQSLYTSGDTSWRLLHPVCSHRLHHLQVCVSLQRL